MSLKYRTLRPVYRLFRGSSKDLDTFLKNSLTNAVSEKPLLIEQQEYGVSGAAESPIYIQAEIRHGR